MTDVCHAGVARAAIRTGDIRRWHLFNLTYTHIPFQYMYSYQILVRILGIICFICAICGDSGYCIDDYGARRLCSTCVLQCLACLRGVSLAQQSQSKALKKECADVLESLKVFL